MCLKVVSIGNAAKKLLREGPSLEIYLQKKRRENFYSVFLFFFFLMKSDYYEGALASKPPLDCATGGYSLQKYNKRWQKPDCEELHIETKKCLNSRKMSTNNYFSYKNRCEIHFSVQLHYLDCSMNPQKLYLFISKCDTCTNRQILKYKIQSNLHT